MTPFRIKFEQQKERKVPEVYEPIDFPWIFVILGYATIKQIWGIPKSQDSDISRVLNVPKIVPGPET